MFDPTFSEFDLGLLEESFGFDAAPPSNIKHEVGLFEDDEAAAAGQKTCTDGWLEATSDLQAFMDIGTLPEINDDQEVETVINDVEQLLQSFECKKENIGNGETCQNLSELAFDDETFAPDEMAAAEELLDELLKSDDLELNLDDLEPQVEQQHVTSEVIEEEEDDEVTTTQADSFIDMTNVTKVITADGKEIYILIAPATASTSSEVVAKSPATEDSDDDEEWTPGESPKTSTSPKGRPPVKRSTNKKYRKSPYIKDKKERKKQQNVEAARRYRDKKKDELNLMDSEEQVLDNKNKELKSQVAELEAEVKTMKKLMTELGIINM